MNFKMLLFLLSLLFFPFSCEVAPAPGCDKSTCILACIDQDVPFGDDNRETVIDENEKRFADIMIPIGNHFVAQKNLRPLWLEVYPLYYQTNANQPLLTYYSGRKNLCTLTQAAADSILRSFSPFESFTRFTEEKISKPGENRRYKQIWPMIRSIARGIENTKADRVLVLIYSDMIERWQTTENEDGVYSFTEPLAGKSVRFNIDCDRVEDLKKDITDTATKVGAAVADCKSQITKANKKVSVYVIFRDNPHVNSNTCGGKNILDEYATALLESSGLTFTVTNIQALSGRIAEVVESAD